MASEGELLRKLSTSLGKHKYNAESLPNLMVHVNEKRMIAWNDDDECLYVCTIVNRIVHVEQILLLSDHPLFEVTNLSLNVGNNFLALHGAKGVMIVDIGRVSLVTGQQGNDTNGVPSKMVRSFLLAERMFLCDPNKSISCVRWHPVSRKTIVLLTNDNCLRVFDVDCEFECAQKIQLDESSGNENVSLSVANIFDELAVSFDFGPCLLRYQNNISDDDVAIFADIYTVYVLKGNGDVLLVYLSLVEPSLIDNHFIYGPLRMKPADDDNYGTDASSILVLDCIPPMIVIGSSTGKLYNCIGIEDDEDGLMVDGRSSKIIVTTSSGHTIQLPDIVLYVYDIIELNFSLSDQLESDGPDSSLLLLRDPHEMKRYLCVHSHGLHIVQIPFLAQVEGQQELDGASSNQTFYSDPSIVEHLICTRQAQSSSTHHQSGQQTFILGLAIQDDGVSTLLSVLFNTGELITKHLVHVPVQVLVSKEKHKNGVLGSISGDGKMASVKQISDSLSINKHHSVLQHLEKMLTKTTKVPFIKSSQDPKAPATESDLEMLFQSIEIFEKQYLGKLVQASGWIQKHKNVLKNDCSFQISQIESLEKKKDAFLQFYEQLSTKYDLVQDVLDEQSKQIERQMISVHNDSCNLSEQDLELKDQLEQECVHLEEYRQKLEQIKKMHQYQSVQSKRLSSGKENQMLPTNQPPSLAQSRDVARLRTKLNEQYKEIQELVSLFKTIKG